MNREREQAKMENRLRSLATPEKGHPPKVKKRQNNSEWRRDGL